MKVVITPSFPQISNPEEMLQLKDILVNLKEERLIPYETSISESRLLCYETGLNEFVEHTGVNNALGRINNAMNQVAAIYSMVNFCAEPMTAPKALSLKGMGVIVTSGVEMIFEEPKKDAK